MKKVKSKKKVKKLKMELHSDPHLRRPEEFGVEGKTIRVGKDIMVVCTVIGAPPHRCCPQYHKSVVAQEKKHRKKIVESGEFGTRSLIVDRKGFNFREIKKEKKDKIKESEDSALKKLAFGWSLKEATEEEKANNKKSQEEGEKLAAVMKTKTNKKENKTKPPKKEIKTDQGGLESKPETADTSHDKSQFKTHKNEVSCRQCNSEKVHECRDDATETVRVRRGGWGRFPGGGLKGGAPAGRSSNVSTFTPIV